MTVPAVGLPAAGVPAVGVPAVGAPAAGTAGGLGPAEPAALPVRRRRVRGLVAGPRAVDVPATSANLGPGFDVVGLALDLHDTYAAEVLPGGGLQVEVHGEGASGVPRDEGHLVVVAMRRAFAAMGASPPGLRLTCTNRIPHGRGLGSSAAAIVGGVALARALVVGGDEAMSDEQLVVLGTELEGHPDNVAAAVLGGFTLACETPLGVRCARLDVHPDLAPVVAVPAWHVPTASARALLPGTVPYGDAVFNVGRAALLVHAVTTDPSLLLAATEDRLHQGYRRATYPNALDLVERLRATGVPAVISGAGPTVLALATTGNAGAVAPLAGTEFAVRRLAVDVRGVREVDPGPGPGGGAPPR